MPHTASPTPAAPAGPPPAMHPMDPRRGENLSPVFTAFLCWLLGLPAMTIPAMTGIAAAGDSVLAATSTDPFFNAHLGSLDDFERNIRRWGDVCGADAATVEGLLARVRRAGQ